VAILSLFYCYCEQGKFKLQRGLLLYDGDELALMATGCISVDFLWLLGVVGRSIRCCYTRDSQNGALN
jgi:hypothetical protein